MEEPSWQKNCQTRNSIFGQNSPLFATRPQFAREIREQRKEEKKNCRRVISGGKRPQQGGKRTFAILFFYRPFPFFFFFSDDDGALSLSAALCTTLVFEYMPKRRMCSERIFFTKNQYGEYICGKRYGTHYVYALTHCSWPVAWRRW